MRILLATDAWEPQVNGVVRTLTRTVRTVAYKAVASLEVTYGEYQARCGCCTSAGSGATSAPGVRPRAVRSATRDSTVAGIGACSELTRRSYREGPRAWTVSCV